MSATKFDFFEDVANAMEHWTQVLFDTGRLR